MTAGRLSGSVPSREFREESVDNRPVGERMRHGFGDMVRHAGVPFVVGVLFVTAIASAVGLLLVHVVDDTALVRLDVRLEDTLEANRTALLDTLTGIGTFFADPIPVAVAWFAAVIVTAVMFKNWRPPLFFMVGIGGEKLSYLLTTLVVDRPRPEVETVGKVHVTSSYPSGHVGSAVSLWAGLALLICTIIACRLDKRALVITSLVALFFAAEVGYSRMYRGHHFLTDVIAGTCIGVAWVVIAYRFVLGPFIRERREKRAVT